MTPVLIERGHSRSSLGKYTQYIISIFILTRVLIRSQQRMTTRSTAGFWLIGLDLTKRLNLAGSMDETKRILGRFRNEHIHLQD